MKSVVNEADKKVKSEYPCLKINTTKNAIVLFYESGCGTIVYTLDDIAFSLGDFSSEWNDSSFTPFKGTVTLSND